MDLFLLDILALSDFPSVCSLPVPSSMRHGPNYVDRQCRMLATIKSDADICFSSHIGLVVIQYFQGTNRGNMITK